MGALVDRRRQPDHNKKPGAPCSSAPGFFLDQILIIFSLVDPREAHEAMRSEWHKGILIAAILLQCTRTYFMPEPMQRQRAL